MSWSASLGRSKARLLTGAPPVVRTVSHPILRRLAAAKRSAQPFPLAWADALYDALDGLEDREFNEWAGVLLATSRAWADAYTGRRSKLTSLDLVSSN